MSRHVAVGKEVLEKEARAILQVMEALNEDFDRAVEALCAAKGRVIFCGIGKSGLVARKIAATFSSVGVPSARSSGLDASSGVPARSSPSDRLVALAMGGMM